MIPGVVIGDVVWMVIGGSFATWLAVTSLPAIGRRLPNGVAIVRHFLHSWIGRVLLLGAWAEVGWHLFCQRP
ncbi:MAG: hypothetical protein M1420_06250 [Actinobacteria bacterium]|jgi:hypothetical protein|nr:hypothetical protein [Actinomycetota bacterium]